MSNIVNIGIVGLGTVGGGVVRVIERHHDKYLAAYGLDLRVRKACARNARHVEELGLTDGVFTSDWHEVVSDPEVDIVVELIGGDHPACDIIEAAFAAGKHVVTANKALLAHDMGRLAGIAHERGVQLKCEAAAAGGIPIVEALEHSFAANDIQAIAGIVNGTTNYMLTRMEREGLSFDEVLRDAQALGFAEADPTADVDGWDAASKMAVLATLGFNTRVTLDDIACVEGIRGLTPVDFEMARELGFVIKLLGIARKTPTGLDVRVHPAMIPAQHSLSSIDGVLNAVCVVGDAVGETMFVGAGAGSFPTASAVLGDVLELAIPLANGHNPQAEAAPYDRVFDVRSIDTLTDCYYVRLTLEDKPGMLGKVASHLAECGVSLASVSQPAAPQGEPTSLIMVTHPAQERDIRAALRAIEGIEGVIAPAAVIRVEDTSAWLDSAL